MAFPIFQHLHEYLAKKGTLCGASIGWHCHLTDLTEIAAKTIVDLGAQLHLSECNASTTSASAVERMRQAGVQVYLGANSAKDVLDKKPLVISDTGFHLTNQYLAVADKEDNWLVGACEITTSGITKMRQQKLSIPVINLNDTTLKSTIENFHGVGDGLIECLSQISDKNFTGRKTAVVGYGQVGAGCAQYLKRIGASVSVIEKDPIRALRAHYDGYQLESLSEALKSTELIVTASGQPKVLSLEEWQAAADGLLVVNVGHFANELDIASLTRIANRKRISPAIEEFSVYKGSPKKIYIATEGQPANVVLLTGSDEPTLIHLTTEMLALAYLIELHKKGQNLESGEVALPRQIEELASLLALKALNISHNSGQLVNESCAKHDGDLESSTQTC